MQRGVCCDCVFIVIVVGMSRSSCVECFAFVAIVLHVLLIALSLLLFCCWYCFCFDCRLSYLIVSCLYLILSHIPCRILSSAGS